MNKLILSLIGPMLVTSIMSLPNILNALRLSSGQAVSESRIGTCNPAQIEVLTTWLHRIPFCIRYIGDF